MNAFYPSSYVLLGAKPAFRAVKAIEVMCPNIVACGIAGRVIASLTGKFGGCFDFGKYVVGNGLATFTRVLRCAEIKVDFTTEIGPNAIVGVA